MRPIFPAVLAAGLALLAFAQDALAGQLAEANGPVTVNGAAAKAGTALKKGDLVATGAGGTAVIKSDAGERLVLESNATVRAEGAEGGVDDYFVLVGAVTGDVSDKTRFGVSVGWATPVKGSKATVRAEAPADRRGVEGRFRAVRGDTWIVNGPTTVWLPAEHTVTLWTGGKANAVCFRTGQQNAGKIIGERLVSGGVVRVEIPRATTGCIEELTGNKTKISNDITSNKQEKIQVSTEFGSASTAQIGPGTYALIDNQTGTIEVVDEGFDESLGEEIPEMAPSDISLQRSKKR